MKKILYLSLMAIVSLLIASCSNNSPGSALKHYMDAMNDKNFEEVVDGIAFKEGLTPEQQQQVRERWITLLQDKAEKSAEQQGAIKSFEIISEEISEDGTTAEVKYKQVFEDGTEKEGTQAMVKRDGKWLMDVGK
ncbi:DUF4878 domain-containing protein [Barnesiella sp. An55]|uniref:DUF4878 domain-containing protein n=1 Tax=Barnesiella sp. An55 TaxID=1965646 RepID=UPI000B373F63|nr:DUF4878 domain-containing protein [Barnesiella sp. An55]OUN73740.1 hypothetical protein B5G10_04055 [Barnesiella sp. An55]HIZ26795.1 DUF4878 domain-containing protein [Candidatus Barnesiella merdipullorum]